MLTKHQNKLLVLLSSCCLPWLSSPSLSHYFSFSHRKRITCKLPCTFCSPFVLLQENITHKSDIPEGRSLLKLQERMFPMVLSQPVCCFTQLLLQILFADLFKAAAIYLSFILFSSWATLCFICVYVCVWHSWRGGSASCRDISGGLLERCNPWTSSVRVSTRVSE